MTAAAPRLRFAIDHNFPDPILAEFAIVLPRVELVPIRMIGPDLADLEDWELFLALHRAGTWDGLITNDDKLLKLPKEMVVLSQTRLTLVVASGEGDDPVRAIGVLLCHLHHICHHTTRERAQVWRLRVKQKNHEEPREFLAEIAARERTSVDALVQAHRATAKELRGVQ